MSFFNLIPKFTLNPTDLIVVSSLLLLFFSPLIHRNTVFSGDEPHYLIVANSILKLGKLDLREAYERQQLGNEFAGKLFQGIPLDHHTVLVDTRSFPPKYLGDWHDYAEGKTTDSHGRQLPPIPQDYREFSVRAIAWPTAIALFSFLTTLSPELAAKILSHLCVLFSAWFIFGLIIYLGRTRDSAILASLAFSLGSCNLLFANTAFADSALLLFYSSASFFFVSKRPLSLAVAIVIGVWLKFQLLLPSIFLFGLAIYKSGFRKNIIPIIVGSFGIGSFFAFNFLTYGLVKPPLDWSFCNPLDSIYYYVIAPNTSFFLRNPWILSSLFFAYCINCRNIDLNLCRHLGTFFLMAITPVFLYKYYDGGYCYPGRLLVCITVPASIVIAYVLDSKGKLKRTITTGLILISLLINWKAAFSPPQLTWKPNWDWLFVF